MRNEGLGDNHGLRTAMMGRMDSVQVFFQVPALSAGVSFESGAYAPGIFLQCPAWQRGGGVWIRRHVPSEPQQCGLTWRRGGGVRIHRHVPTEPVCESDDVLSPWLNGGWLSTLVSASSRDFLFAIGVLRCKKCASKCASMFDDAMIGVCDVKACKIDSPFPLPELQPIHGVGRDVPEVGFCGCKVVVSHLFFSAKGQQGIIWDATFERSAEAMRFSMVLLQRQNLLPVAFGYANGLAERTCTSDRHIPKQTLGSPCLFLLSYVSGCQRKQCSWLCDMIRRFPFYFAALSSHLLCQIWLFTNALGGWWQQAFVFLVLAGGVHMCQLLLYAVQLKGGQCNVDNLLRCSRKVCGGCPLDSALVLMKFSPRFSSPQPLRQTGFSGDLWLFLVFISALCNGVVFGAGSRHNVDCTGFRARRRSRKLASAVYNLRSACRSSDSSGSSDEHPDDQPPEDPSPGGDGDWDVATDNFLFQFYSFGCLPSYMVCALLTGISLQEAIDQVSVDAIVPVHEESGIFIPAKGVPLGMLSPSYGCQTGYQHLAIICSLLMYPCLGNIPL